MKKATYFAAVLFVLGLAGSAQAATFGSGSLVVNFSLTISSLGGGPAYNNDGLTCSVVLTMFDSTGRLFSEIATVAASRATPTSTTATCKVAIPYSWPLTSQPPGGVLIAATVSVPGINATSTNALPSRTSSQSLAPLTTVPPNGTITTRSAVFVI